MKRLEHIVERYPELSVCLSSIQSAFDLLRETYRRDGKLMVCGNGGSAADSEHIVGELMKGFHLRRKLTEVHRKKLLDAFPANGEYLAEHLQGALPALSLVSQTSLVTAYANDVASDMVFAQQVYGYGLPGDTLLGISTSGSSGNVIHALQVARAFGIHTIGLAGDCANIMREVCEVVICAPGSITSDIQEYHQAIYHSLCAELEEAFFPL